MLSILPEKHLITKLFILFGANSGIGICNSDGQLGSPFDKGFPVFSRNSTSNLGTVCLVGHHEYLQLLDVVDQDLLEASGHHVTGGAGTALTNVGHLKHSLEPWVGKYTNIISTTKTYLESPPVPLDIVIPARLVPGELLHPLPDNLGPAGRGESHGETRVSETGLHQHRCACCPSVLKKTISGLLQEDMLNCVDQV